MDFNNVISTRKSVRKYSDKKVEKEKLDAILETARIAPTAHNYQPQKIVVVNSAQGLAELQEGSNVFGAPLALIVCADHNQSWKRDSDEKDSGDIDASIVTTYMMLKARELGLDSVWVCNFKPDVVKEKFNIPENVEPINILIVGYAHDSMNDPARKRTGRKQLEETVVWEKF